MPSREEMQVFLAGLLACFQGREYSEPIDGSTRFFADLGFGSIDAVVLGETIENHFGQKLPFPAFLAELGRAGATDIEVGRLAEFLAAHLPDSPRPR